MREIYQKIAELFKEGRICVLATIITQAGSSPRGPGSKMVIMEDGSIIGSVGGGMLEGRVIEEGKKIFSTLTPTLIRHKMHGADIDANEMICGGDADIFIEPIFPDNPVHLELFKEIFEIVKRGGAGLLATVIDPERWDSGQIPKMFIKNLDEKTGSILDIPEIEADLRDQYEGKNK